MELIWLGGGQGISSVNRTGQVWIMVRNFYWTTFWTFDQVKWRFWKSETVPWKFGTGVLERWPEVRTGSEFKDFLETGSNLLPVVSQFHDWLWSGCQAVLVGLVNGEEIEKW